MLMDIFINLVSDFTSAVLALSFAYFVYTKADQKRFGGWMVIIEKGGEVLARRQVSVRKAKVIFDDAADLSVYLKGVVSPFAWIKADILDPATGLMVTRYDKRQIIINLDKNPA